MALGALQFRANVLDGARRSAAGLDGARRAAAPRAAIPMALGALDLDGARRSAAPGRHGALG
eukprot:11800071-Heterocapsa_arctica.AAC.1